MAAQHYQATAGKLQYNTRDAHDRMPEITATNYSTRRRGCAHCRIARIASRMVYHIALPIGKDRIVVSSTTGIRPALYHEITDHSHYKELSDRSP